MHNCSAASGAPHRCRLRLVKSANCVRGVDKNPISAAMMVLSFIQFIEISQRRCDARGVGLLTKFIDAALGHLCTPLILKTQLGLKTSGQDLMAN